MQNKNRNKVTELCTHPVNINFNTDKPADKRIKHAFMQRKVVGDLCSNNNKLSNNCQVNGKKTNLYSCNVSVTNCSLRNKSEPRTANLCLENNKLQTSSMFENVKKFTCLHQMSQFDNRVIHDVVTESSNTRVAKAKNGSAATKRVNSVKSKANCHFCHCHSRQQSNGN